MNYKKITNSYLFARHRFLEYFYVIDFLLDFFPLILNIRLHAHIIFLCQVNSSALSGGLKVPTKSLNLLSVLLEQGFLGQLLIDLGPVGDVFGSMSVIESRQCLLNAADRRGNCGDDGSLGASTQRFLEQSSQLGLSEIIIKQKK